VSEDKMDFYTKITIWDLARLQYKEELLNELIQAIETKWKKTPPPKELIEPYRQAKELLGERAEWSKRMKGNERLKLVEECENCNGEDFFTHKINDELICQKCASCGNETNERERGDF